MLTVVDEGNFVRAGEKLGYTQSGITQMMTSMENELGFALFVRGNRGVRLTPEAELLLPKIRDLLNANAILEQECAQIKGIETGHINIGSFTSMSIRWLPMIMEQFLHKHPGVHIEMIESGSADELERMLREGQIDLCFYSLPDDHEFDQIELFQDELHAVLPLGHKLQDCEIFPLSAFNDEPFLIFKSASGYDRDIMTFLKATGLKPDIKFSSNFDFSIISMVEHNLGISILPHEVIKCRMENIISKPLDLPAYRRLGIAAKNLKQLSPAVERFIASARETVKEMLRSDNCT